MSTETALDPLDRAINAESWDWLESNQPLLAETVQTVVVKGADPERIYRHMLKRLGMEREALARRCKQAAQHLASR